MVVYAYTYYSHRVLIDFTMVCMPYYGVGAAVKHNRRPKFSIIIGDVTTCLNGKNNNL